MHKFDKKQLENLWEKVFEETAHHLEIPVDISNHGHVATDILEFISRSMTNGWHNTDLREIYEDLSKKNQNTQNDIMKMKDHETLIALQGICKKVMEPSMIALEKGKDFDIETAVINASQNYFGYDIKNTLEHDNSYNEDKDEPPPFLPH